MIDAYCRDLSFRRSLSSSCFYLILGSAVLKTLSKNVFAFEVNGMSEVAARACPTSSVVASYLSSPALRCRELCCCCWLSNQSLCRCFALQEIRWCSGGSGERARGSRRCSAIPSNWYALSLSLSFLSREASKKTGIHPYKCRVKRKAIWGGHQQGRGETLFLPASLRKQTSDDVDFVGYLYFLFPCAEDVRSTYIYKYIYNHKSSNPRVHRRGLNCCQVAVALVFSAHLSTFGQVNLQHRERKRGMQLGGSATVVRPQRWSYAVDLEFLKTRGEHFARAVAFVPFQRNRSTDPSTSHRTNLMAAPIVLELQPSAVMALSEALPCGHLLSSHIQQTVVRGEALEEIKRRYEAEAVAEWDAFKDLRRSAKETRLNGAAKHTNSLEKDLAVDGDGGSALPSPSPVDTAAVLTPVENLLKKTLQSRVSITRYFSHFDPYTVPSTRLLGREAAEQLYAADVNSRAFLEASRLLRPLRAYGRGRGGSKPIAYLSRYHPHFLQAVLHASFPSAALWTAWLQSCQTLVAEELRATHSLYQSSQYPKLPQSADRLSFKACDSLEELSQELNHTWSRLLHEVDGNSTSAKFYVYGSNDAAVIHRTLQLSCSTPAIAGIRFSPRALQAGATSGSSDSSKWSLTSNSESSSDSSSAPGVPSRSKAAQLLKDVVQSVPTTHLVSPYQAKVVDITTHPLFVAGGYANSQRKIPRLAAALAMAARGDATAVALETVDRPHDPLWDAQALACVCVGVGAVR